MNIKQLLIPHRRENHTMKYNPTSCTVPAKAVNPPQKNALTVIIASAGIGRRMKSKGAKALLPVYSNMPILEHQLKTVWKAYPQANIIVAIGFQANKIRAYFRNKYPMRFVYNPNYETNNVLCSIALALESSMPSNLLILHGDIIFNVNTISALNGTSSKILVLPTTTKDTTQEVGVVIQDNRVTNLSYGLSKTWGQMAYLTGDEAKHFESVAFNYEQYSNCFFHEGINEVINRGGVFYAHTPSNINFIEVDSLDDLSKARNIII